MRADFVEDIPTCNQWVHGSPYINEEQLKNSVYANQPTFWIKEMLASIGQRGMWNYAHGLGPCIDGTVPELFAPMIKKMGEFLSWAGESVYGTIGGGNSALCPGWCWKNGFASVTVSLADPSIHYLHHRPRCGHADSQYQWPGYSGGLRSAHRQAASLPRSRLPGDL